MKARLASGQKFPGKCGSAGSTLSKGDILNQNDYGSSDMPGIIDVVAMMTTTISLLFRNG